MATVYLVTSVEPKKLAPFVQKEGKIKTTGTKMSEVTGPLTHQTVDVTLSFQNVCVHSFEGIFLSVPLSQNSQT